MEKQHVYKPPMPYNKSEDRVTVFLAGSIEMGEAEDWQTMLTEKLAETGLPHDILNPRRDDWSSDWEQSIENEQFKDQVTWELSGIESADLILVYFDENTKSPITLLELGLISKGEQNVLVCCPEGFYRKGNVDVVAERYGFTVMTDKERFCKKAKEYLVDEVLGMYRREESPNVVPNESSDPETSDETIQDFTGY